MLSTLITAAAAVLLCEPTAHQTCTQQSCKPDTKGYHVILNLDLATIAHCQETVHGCAVRKVRIDRDGAGDAITVDADDVKFRLWPSMDYTDVRLGEATAQISFGKCRVKR
jgi:hypothetical protein